MNWPTFSLKQLFVSVFLMSVGMAGITFAARYLERRSPEWATTTVLGAVVATIGVIMLVAKRRRTLALIWVLSSVLIGVGVGGVAAKNRHPGIEPALSNT
jgi:hypothetical protein